MPHGKRLIAYIGDKGGSGKSMGATVHAAVLRRAGRDPLLVDTDGEVGHLARMYHDADVRRFSFHQQERDRVDFAEVLDTGRDLVLVDLPAASVTLMGKVERDYGFFRLAHEAGYAVTLVVVVTPDPASLASVEGAADLDPLADLVVLRNLAFGEMRDFLVWDGSEDDGVRPSPGKLLLAKRGGRDLRLPLLDRGTVALMAAFGLTFENARTSRLKAGRRSQVDTFLRKVETEFSKAGGIMGLAAVAQEASA